MLERGCVVISTAGKDRDGWMVVIQADDTGVWVADGRHRRLETPKRKNPRHLRSTSCRLEEPSMATNRELRRALTALAAKSTV